MMSIIAMMMSSNVRKAHHITRTIIIIVETIAFSTTVLACASPAGSGEATTIGKLVTLITRLATVAQSAISDITCSHLEITSALSLHKLN